MPLDGITLNSVKQELSQALIGGRVDRIQQPEADEIIIAIRSQGKNHKLLLNANANSPRIHFTEISKPSPPQAPMFCMLLRKHLGGGRILDIQQPDFERMVEIYIESPNEMGDLSVKRLIIEIMGKHSNIILVDARDTIMDSIRHVSRELSSVREVMPGRGYTRPPSQGKLPPVPIDTEHFLNLLKTESKRVQHVIYQSYNGISPIVASEICLRASVAADAFAETLSDTERERLLNIFAALYEDIENGRFNCHIYEDVKRDFSAVFMNIYDGWEMSEAFTSPSKMLETFYRKQDNMHRLSQKTADLRRLVSTYIERSKRKSEIHQKTLLEIEDREQQRKFGEVLTAYIYAIPEGADRVKLADFYEGDREIEIPLDPTKTAVENAQYYFKAYNKAKRTFAALQEQMQSNEEDLAYLDSVLTSISTAADEEDIADIRTELAEQNFIKKRPQAKGKKPKKSKPLHYMSSDGFNIYVGKNNTQNDELSMRFAHPNDIWMHTKEIPGSHVIIQTAGKELPDKTILEGAMLAAYHSKGRHSSQVPVDFCPRKNVRKPRGAKPGFVIYDVYNTVYVSPDEKEVERLGKDNA